jgi:hypothetical protein
MARLIANPDQTDGAPPFALTDQTGTIQRYVEPVPGIELAPYVGRIVIVRHDTGTTLLASQLELPPQPLRPMVGPEEDRYAAANNRAGIWRRTAEPDSMVQQAQYIDNDDSSVQLLPDDVPIPGGNPGRGDLMPLESMPQGGQHPVFIDPMGPPGMQGPMYGPQFEPMPYGPEPMMAYPNQMMDPCSQCGQFHGTMGDPHVACPPAASQRARSRFSADIQLSMLRPQWAENAIGKLSEEYQFSPRAMLAFRGLGNLDGRVRYWHFGREADVLDGDGDVRFRFNVFDIEATHHFAGRRSEVTLGSGVRLAGIRLTDTADEKSDADLIGLTLAADGTTPLGKFRSGHFGLVYGGRLSILGGDWGGDDDSEFVDSQARNDNMLVHELYGGVELARRFGGFDAHARLVFEMQNWKSDVLAEDADIESIGFFGPSLQLGADF